MSAAPRVLRKIIITIFMYIYITQFIISCIANGSNDTLRTHENVYRSTLRTQIIFEKPRGCAIMALRLHILAETTPEKNTHIFLRFMGMTKDWGLRIKKNNFIWSQCRLYGNVLVNAASYCKNRHTSGHVSRTKIKP